MAKLIIHDEKDVPGFSHIVPLIFVDKINHMTIIVKVNEDQYRGEAAWLIIRRSDRGRI